MPDPWRYRCPEGHTSIVTRPSKSTYRCRSCGKTYSGGPVDAKADTPATATRSESFDSVHPRTAVLALYRETGGTVGTAKAKHLSSRTTAYGQALHEAKKRGFVTVQNPDTCGANRWRLTNAGVRLLGTLCGVDA